MNSAWLLVGSSALVSAGLYLATQLGSFGSLLLAVMTPLPLFLIGLSMGGRIASIAGVTAAMIVILAVNTLAGVMFIVTHALPVVLISWKATVSRPADHDPSGSTREWYPAGMLAAWLTVVPLATLVFAFVYGAANGDTLQAMVARHMEPLLQMIQAAPSDSFPGLETPPPEQLALIEELIVLFVPMGVALFAMVTTLFNAIVAQGMLSRLGRNLRPAPRMAEIELPLWLVASLAACLAINFLLDGNLGFLAITAAGILAFPVFLSGLGVAHAVAERTKSPFAILFMTYVLLVIAGWIMFMVMATVGLIDHFAGLKARLRAGSSSP